jgi:hypothetical protein
MFKFASKGDNHNNEAALFYNGQRLLTVYAAVVNDEVSIIVDDGTDVTKVMWEDYLEDHEHAD